MAISEPFQGVMFHWIGGLAAASFYIPYRAIKRGRGRRIGSSARFRMDRRADDPGDGARAGRVGADLVSTASRAGAYFFGILWGVGGSTFGLTMRYLGIALGMAADHGLVRRVRHAGAAGGGA